MSTPHWEGRWIVRVVRQDTAGRTVRKFLQHTTLVDPGWASIVPNPDLGCAADPLIHGMALYIPAAVPQLLRLCDFVTIWLAPSMLLL